MKDSGHSSDSGPEERRPDATSSSLIDGAQRGDRDSWRRLVAMYRPLVRWWCRRQRPGWRTEDIEDVVQEVFKTVAHKVQEFRRKHMGGFRGWLREITRFQVLGYGKPLQHEAQAAGGSGARERLENVPDAADPDSSIPDDATERVILLRAAMNLVTSEFQPRTWQAAWRVMVEGHSSRDVATDLGMSVAAVYTARSRVRTRLRQVIDDLEEGDEPGGGS